MYNYTKTHIIKTKPYSNELDKTFHMKTYKIHHVAILTPQHNTNDNGNHHNASQIISAKFYTLARKVTITEKKERC